MIRPGDAASDFVLQNISGQDRRLSTLHDGPVVVCFLPRWKLPSTRAAIQGLKSRRKAIEATGARLVIVTGSDPETVRERVAKWEVPFEVLLDKEFHAHDLYDAWITSLGGRNDLAVLRCTYVVDDAGVIHDVLRRVTALTHAQQLVRALKRMNAQKSWGSVQLVADPFA